MMEPVPLLKLSGINFEYSKKDSILQNINLEVKHGELITLLGPNGAGKSTLLNCTMGLLNYEGKIEIEGKDIKDMTSREIAKNIAYVSQEQERVFAHLVRDYIVMGRAPYLNVFQKPSKEDYEMVDAVIESMGIQKLSKKAYTKLSGGERQLVNVCRAIVQKPKMILFDEPTSALDYGNQIKVLRMVKDLSRKGFSIIITTHNPDHAILLEATACVLDQNGTLYKGTVEEIITEKLLNKIYNAKLKIKYLEEEERIVCITERL